MGRVKAANKGSPDKKPRKQRKKKDKDAPKRPCTAFFYYVHDQRCKGEHKDMKVSEFTKQCGARWKMLSDHQKSDFFSSASQDRERYDKEKKNYKPAPGSAAATAAPAKDPNKPKKPMTPFLLFVGSIRKQLVDEGYTHRDVLSQAAERWKVISSEDKEPLLQEAAKLKKAYEVAMQKYNAEKNAKPAITQVKAAAQKNGKDSEDESDEEEEEESEEEEDDDEDMESDDE